MHAFLVILLLSSIISPSIPLPSPHISAFRGTDLPLTVQLRDLSGNPIDDATVLFFHEQQNTLLGTALTNITGHATFFWSIPITHPLGLAQLNATFPGDPERYLLPSTVPIAITIYGQMHATINVEDAEGQPISSIVKIGQQLCFRVLIYDDQMSPMENITVQLLKEPNQLINQGMTLTNGSITFKYTLNFSAMSLIVFTIRSLNDGYYNGTEHLFHFLIANSSVHFIGLPAFLHSERGYQVEGQLCQTMGYGVFNASIELLQESRIAIQSVQTDSNGFFRFNLLDLRTLLSGNRYIILRYNGEVGYCRAEALIGIIPGSSINPFSHSVDPDASNSSFLLLHQVGLIALSCLTITTTLIAWRRKRVTTRIFTH